MKSETKTKSGYKYNCIHVETGAAYWVSGPRKDGADKLYGGQVHIDDDTIIEYWTTIREQPDRSADAEYRAGVSTRTSGSTRRNERRVRGVARG